MSPSLRATTGVVKVTLSDPPPTRHLIRMSPLLATAARGALIVVVAALWQLRAVMASAASPLFECTFVTLRLLLRVGAQAPLLSPSEAAWRSAELVLLGVRDTLVIRSGCVYADDAVGTALASRGAELDPNGTFVGAFDYISSEVMELFSNDSVAVNCTIANVSERAFGVCVCVK